MNKTGFTLAEVLITLGVIGIVSAITIPNVIKNYQKNLINKQFITAYNLINNSMRMIVARDDILPQCYKKYNQWNSNAFVTVGCRDFYSKLSGEMKILNKCEGQALQNGCIAGYPMTNIKSSCITYSSGNINTSSWAYVLANGQILITYGNANNYLFLVDVNGKKGPNKGGYDLFGFSLQTKDEGLSTYLALDPICADVKEDGGRTTEEVFNDAIKH